MTPENWSDVKRIFHQALELPASERAHFITRACGADTALRSEIESLVNSHELAEDFIVEPVAVAAARLLMDGVSEIQAGEQIDGYRLIRELGRGGMGVVYLAKREDVGGEVAIKILANALLSPARRDRFTMEERTLAALKHEYIAQLYDAGILEGGTPWFAMEYVDGVEITKHCRDVSIEECLKLFRMVCEAVRYAHSQNVIHRDLKPSNILVRSVQQGSAPKLLDFGIAKQLDVVSSSVESFTVQLMTPRYAAPEQFQGLNTPQTDVYSLGVILYQLIAGRHPFEGMGHGLLEMERIVTETTPELPSQVAKRAAIAGQKVRQPRAGSWADLDVLCLHAMHKDPARRYGSVEALQRDVDHYLASEPLEMRGDDVTYKLGKFVKRHRSSLLAAALVLVLGISAGTFFTLRLRRAREEAQNAAARTLRVQRFMLKLFAGGSQQPGPAADLKVVTLIQEGVREAQSLNREPEVQAELYLTLGNSYRHLGSLNEADALLTAALNQRRHLFGPEHPQVAESLVALGLLRMDQARLDEAEQLIRDGLEMTRLSQSDNNNAFARATTALGNVLSTRGDYKNAIAALEDAVKILDVNTPSPELLETLAQLSDTSFYAGQYDLCDSVTRRALAMGRELFGERHISSARALLNLGAIRFQQSNFVESEQNYREALRINQAWYGKDHVEVSSNLTNLAQSLIAQKRYDEGQSYLLQALEMAERVFPKDHPRIAFPLNELGTVANETGKLADAEKYFERAAELNMKTYGEKHFRTVTAMSNLAVVYYKRGDFVRAESTLRKVVEGYTAISPEHLNTAIGHIKLAGVLAAQRRFKEAELEGLAGYEIALKNPSATWIKIARETLVEIYDGLKDSEKARIYRELIQKG